MRTFEYCEGINNIEYYDMRRMVTMTLYNKEEAAAMKDNVAVRSMLEELGWKYDGNCNCNGQYSDKYYLPAGPGQRYEMKVRRSSFLLKRHDTNKFTKMPIALLKQTVDEIKELGE